MIFTLLVNIAIISMTYILQSSLIAALPSPFNFISLPLIAIILMTYVFGLKEGLIGAISLGFFLDHESTFFIGSIVLSYIIITLLIKILSDKVFTNKSLYSNTALCLIGSICQIVLLYPLNFNYFKISLGWNQLVGVIVWQIILNILLADLIFYMLLIFHKELKAYFLIK